MSRGFYLTTLLVITMTLYCLLFWGFAIRLWLPAGYHFLFPLAVVLFFLSFLFFAVQTVRSFQLPSAVTPLLTIGIVVLNFYTFTSLSSVRRESEIKNYFSKNETALTDLVHHFGTNGNDETATVMMRALNLERFEFRENKFQARLYTCFGYGYGIICADNSEIANPGKLGGSPVTSWIKIKDNWYYYSIFD